MKLKVAILGFIMKCDSYYLHSIKMGVTAEQHRAVCGIFGGGKRGQDTICKGHR